MRKNYIGLITSILVLVLSGCFFHVNAEQLNGSQEPFHRELSPEEFGSSIPYLLSYHDTSSDLYRGNEVEESGGLRVIFRPNILENIDMKDMYTSQNSVIEFIVDNFPADVFGKTTADTDCVEMEYVSIQDTYLYFKITVKNSELLCDPYTSWTESDEIYMMLKGGVGTFTSGDMGLQFTYFIKNFSTEQEELYSDEVTYADWSTLCTKEPIQTELYSITVPDSWINKCAYDLTGDGNGISFKIPHGYDGTYDSGLCTIAVVYGSLKDVLVPYMFIETIESESYGICHLIVEYPGDKQYTDAYQDEYIMLADDIRLLVDSITLTDETVLISTEEPVYKDFNIYDYDNVVEKYIEYIESPEETIVQPYDAKKIIYKSGVVPFFQGREYDNTIIAECLIEHEFNNADISLEYVGTYSDQTNIHTAPTYYLYYKVRIKDIQNVQQNYAAHWRLNDDIYVIARTNFVFTRIEGEEEDLFYIAYHVKNFSIDSKE